MELEICLLGTLEADVKLRKDCTDCLDKWSKEPDFIITLIEKYPGMNDSAQFMCMILIKNLITKYWLKKNRISDANKVQVKQFILTLLHVDDRKSKLVIEAVAMVNKYDFLDSWPGLLNYLAVVQHSELYLQILHRVLKIQLLKGSARCKNNVAELSKVILPMLIQLWTSYSEVLIEKIVTKFALVAYTQELLEHILSRVKSYIASDNFKLAKTVLKGMHVMIIKISNLLTPVATVLMEFYMQICKNYSSSTEQRKELLPYVFLSIKDMLTKFPQVAYIIKPDCENLLNKTLEAELDERWELWNNGDYSNFLDSTEEVEEDCVRKLQEALLKNFPDLFIVLKKMMRNDMSFLQVHTLCSFYSILYKFPQAIGENDYKIIITWLNEKELEGLEKLVILRDALILTRRWINLLSDYSLPYELLLRVKSFTSDTILLYECCLTLKQMTYMTLPAQTLIQIVNDFGLLAFQLIPAVQSPSCIWHLVTFISNLIQSSNSNDIFIQGLTNLGLSNLLVDSNEIVLSSISDMLEQLLIKFPGNNSLNEIIYIHLSTRLQRGDKSAFQFWLTFLNNFQGSHEPIDKLIPYLKEINQKNKWVNVKILEEYLLIYYEKSMFEKINELIYNCPELYKIHGNSEDDFIVLELILCMTIVASFGDENALKEVHNYLKIGKNDIYEEMCLTSSVMIISQILEKSPQYIAVVDFTLWFEKVQKLNNHNQIVLCTRALRKIIPYISQNLQGVVQEVVNKYCNFIENEDKKTSKSNFSDLSLSERFKRLMFA
ncbi:hypothetical protein SteCoe_25230 [Stentor coeruleus]|uniref:Importin N-terminal domain-containing protein n=1 Tax=Stentor coeruleus TaxID=5963 RepID=A0A1R2BFW0_9CILI|nr:hypothetical protein SteCoe_25230 [Stentor coeruleus]